MRLKVNNFYACTHSCWAEKKFFFVVLKMSFKVEENCGDNLMVSLYSLIYPLGPNCM